MAVVGPACHAASLPYNQMTSRRKPHIQNVHPVIQGIFVLLGVLTIPDIAREGADFVNRLQSDNIWVRRSRCR